MNKFFHVVAFVIGIHPVLSLYAVEKDTMEVWQNRVINTGDTLTYKKLLNEIPYQRSFFLAVYMANEYNYGEAFIDALLILNEWYKTQCCTIDSVSLSRWQSWFETASFNGSTACTRLKAANYHQSIEILDSISERRAWFHKWPIETPPANGILVEENDGFHVWEEINGVMMRINGPTKSIQYDDYVSACRSYVETGDNESRTTIMQYGSKEVKQDNYFFFRLCGILKYNNWDVTGLTVTMALSKHYSDYYCFCITPLGINLLQGAHAHGDIYSSLPLAIAYMYISNDADAAKKVLEESYGSKANRMMDVAKKNVKRMDCNYHD